MISITEKTLQDLQFSTVLETISAGCNTDIGKEKALQILPFKEKQLLMNALMQTSEYVSSFQNNNAIPNHGFEAIHHEIKFLGIRLFEINSLLFLFRISSIITFSSSLKTTLSNLLTNPSLKSLIPSL